MKKKANKKGMAIAGENILVRVKVSKVQYEKYKQAAANDKRSFSQWAEIALEEKLIRETGTPRP